MKAASNGKLQFTILILSLIPTFFYYGNERKSSHADHIIGHSLHYLVIGSND